MNEIKSIIELRHLLHSEPELSNHEFDTSEKISHFFHALNPDSEVNIASTGKIFIFDGETNGTTLMFRAELDALPITEVSGVEYASENKGVAHSCGHDGHMAIVAGLAQKISQNKPHKGRVAFLFQPAEEIEQGARDVVNDPGFQSIEPDYIFALHNIPGLPKNNICTKYGSFAAASKGLTIKLTGKTSHAAEPEMGISPVHAIQHIVNELSELINNKTQFKDLTLLTFIHIQMGEIAFGTSPGYAEIRITLRAFLNEDMDFLTERVEQIIGRIAQKEKLELEMEYSEIFPALVNNDKCVEIIKQAAIENGLTSTEMEKPFKWSEDFSYYSMRYNAGFFGLGAGEETPNLHNLDYNFPDDIIESGITMFYSIYRKIMGV